MSAAIADPCRACQSLDHDLCVLKQSIYAELVPLLPRSCGCMCGVTVPDDASGIWGAA